MKGNSANPNTNSPDGAGAVGLGGEMDDRLESVVFPGISGSTYGLALASKSQVNNYKHSKSGSNPQELSASAVHNGVNSASSLILMNRIMDQSDTINSKVVQTQ